VKIDRPDAPTPTPIGDLSPTLGEELLACALRVAFKRDVRFQLLRRGNTFSALGSAGHHLSEEVARGELSGVPEDGRRAALEARFDELLGGERDKLAAAWPTGKLPQVERWPRYRLTRRMLVRRLEAQLSGAGGRGVSSGVQVKIEEEIKDPREPIAGRPDRVELRADGAHLIDLKSGSIEAGLVPDRYRRQLLVYAYLWHSLHGAWPVEAEIRTLDGRRHPVEVDREEAGLLVSDLLARRLAFNEAAATEAWQLGTPSADTCEHCPYVAACPRFFEAIDEGWGWYRRSLVGVAISTEGEIKVEVEAGNLVMGQAADARVLASGVAAEAGETLAVTGTRPTGASAEVRLEWNSVVYSWTRNRLLV
jgi:hypothetical protein